MVDFKSKLAKFGKTFKTAKQRAKEEGFGAELPDGKYMTKLESCELGTSQASGRLQLTFVYKITDGEQKGETIRKYLGLETEDDQMWLDRELKKFGIAIESLEEVEEVAKLLNSSKAVAKVTLKTKDSGQFAYLDSVLSEIDASDFAANEDGDDEEDQEEEEDVEETEDSDDEDEDGDEDSEEETEDEEEDSADIEVGMTAAFEGKTGKEIVGKVIAILEKTNEVKIKSGDKTYTTKVDNLYIPEVSDEDETEEEEEEDEVEEVKKPVKKTTKAKPSAAKKTTSKRK